MKIARYWTRAHAAATDRDGKTVSAMARGWSNDSLDAARACAVEIAQRVAERIASKLTSRAARYPYGDRPLPEPVIQEFRSGGDAVSAIVTRNAYGALVLNASQLMFVDVDRPDKQSNAGATIGNMFSSPFAKPKA